MLTVLFAGRLQQREDLQTSLNDSSQLDLYERFVFICNPLTTKITSQEE